MHYIKSSKYSDIRAKTYNTQYFGIQGSIRSIAYSPNGKMFALTSEENISKKRAQWFTSVFDLLNREILLKIEGTGLYNVCFSPDSKKLAAPYQGISIFDIESGQQEQNIKTNIEYNCSFCLSPDGTRLAAAGWYETEEYSDRSSDSIGVWRLSDGKTLWQKRWGWCKDVCFSKDGRVLYVLEEGPENCWLTSEVEVVTTDSGKKLWNFSQRGMRLYCLDISQDGRLLAGGGAYQDPDKPVPVIIWDTASGEESIRLKGHRDSLISVVLSPNGKMAATSSYNHTYLWDIKTGKKLRIIKEIGFAAEKLAFSPDGKFLAAAHEQQGLKFVELSTEKE